MDDLKLTAHAYTRRKFLALSAAGTAAAALAACGGTAASPTRYPGPDEGGRDHRAGADRNECPAVARRARSPPPPPRPHRPPPRATAPAASAAAARNDRHRPRRFGGQRRHNRRSPPTSRTSKSSAIADVEPQSFDPGVPSTPYATPHRLRGVDLLNWTDNQLEPAAARSYAANADATVWTFKMRPGLKWSDGTPMTAKDFEYSIKRLPDPKTASKYTAALQIASRTASRSPQGRSPPDHARRQGAR